MIETPSGSPIDEGHAYLGRLTNNQAEYEALLLGLEAVDLDPGTEVVVYSDSELLVRQLNGEYRVKSPGLRERYRRARRYLESAGAFVVRHVPREENAEADALANQAIDAYALEEEA